MRKEQANDLKQTASRLCLSTRKVWGLVKAGQLRRVAGVTKFLCTDSEINRFLNNTTEAR